MLKRAILTLLAVFCAAGAQAENAASNGLPQWFLDEIEFLTRDGGTWKTSNAEYQSENEPFDAYGLEWKKGYANSMTGRLYALQDGEPTGDFWRFRQYWDPAQKKVIVMQFGFGGAIGIGPTFRDGEITKMEQKFYGPDGSVRAVGHHAKNIEPDTHVTESFAIVDDEWRPDRKYTWRRQAADAKDD